MSSPSSDTSTAEARSVAASVSSSPGVSRDTWGLLRDYWTLTKPEISFLVTISALAGFLIGSPGAIDVWTLLVTLVGTGLCAGGVGVLNHCMEQDLDARMKRTAARPLPAGRVNPTTAGFFGMALVAAGIGLLCPLVNPLTAILAALTAVLYLFVYTPLKQVTTYNTLIGTIPGALPALGGYTAATGSVGWGGWTAFAVLACWQMPHFLSLAWMYRKDYARGEYAMLPVEQPDGDATAYQMIGFTVLLLAASLVPSVWGDAHLLYTVGAAALGGWFLYTAVRFFRRRTGHQARRVLKASIVYVPVWVALLFVDWLLT